MTVHTIERRGAAAEIRAAGRRLAGHAAVFNVPADLGGITETVRPGAFTRTLGEGRDILALQDHDPGRVLARTKSGTLRLAEDSRGLSFEIDLANTTLANDLLEMVTRGDVGGASFGFRVRRDGEHWEGRKRELRAVDLIEVSIVSSFPAYPQTDVSARSLVSPSRMALRAFLEART